MATALAGEVLSFDGLAPAGVAKIEKRYRRAIGGDDAYWRSKRDSRFATLVELTQVEPIDVGPTYKVAYMKAWYVLDEALSPVRDYVLTAGAIRNRYASLPAVAGRTKSAASSRAITLDLPDGPRIETDLASGRMLRWRGWGVVYDAAQARPGDRLRFVAVGPNHYRVSVVKATP